MKLKDQKLEPIFKRREEIRLEINKLMEEYKALEYVLSKNRQLEEQLNNKQKPDYSSWDSIEK